MKYSLPSKENYSVPEVADVLSVSKRHVYYLIKNKKIVTRKYGNIIRVHVTDLNNYMESCKWLGEESLESNQHSSTEKTAIPNTGTSNIGTKNKIDGDTAPQEPRIMQLPSTT